MTRILTGKRQDQAPWGRPYFHSDICDRLLVLVPGIGLKLNGARQWFNLGFANLQPSEIGKLSAEAIVKEYEETAKEIEAMGNVVREMVQRCEQLTASASAMLKDIKSTAARYRKEGKRMFTEIESCSSATDEVRRLCESFRDKLAARDSEAIK